MPEFLERQVEDLEVRASFVPKTLDKEKRTIDVVFATDTPCRMFSWEDGAIDEILSFDPGHVRLDRLNGGAPVLDNHSRYEGTSAVLGVVENARVEDGKGIATLRFSKRADVEGTWQDVQDGILTGVSVGYRVHKYEITKEEGKTPQYRAVDWEGFEISMAPVQADPNSKVRSNSNKNFINNQNNNQMTELEKRALAAGLPQNATLAEVERAEADTTRKAKEAEDKATSAGATAERSRIKDINDIVRKGSLEKERAEKMIADAIEKGSTADAVRALVLDAVAEANETNVRNQNANVTVGTEAVEKKRAGMVDAIDHRANPTIALTDAGAEFRSMSLMDMARMSLEEGGVKTRNMTPREVAQAALGLSGRHYMSSSDFPNIMGTNVNRSLRRAYQLWAPTFTAWTQRGTFTDFRPKSVIQLGDVTKMKQIQEGGEYNYGNMPENAESYAAKKYGLIIPITWEALINDDLSAFSRIPSSIANKARQLQSDIVYGIVSANAALSDGVALFHATHANLAGAGSAISIASLQAGRTAIRTQKDVNGVDVLNLVPKYLIVGPLQEQLAYQFTSSQYVPTKNSDINPVYNTRLEVIVEPRITGNEWYLAADPGMIDTIEYSFLRGEEEIFTEQRIGWEVDGMETKARMVFNAKAIDYRGLYKNPGA